LRPRAQRLLAYLLLHRRMPYTRERIAFSTWPDSTEKEALGTLRRALSDLRTALPPRDDQWIIAEGGDLRWNPDSPYWLDIERFECLVGQATPAALHDAVALQAGDLLAEWDDEWVQVERERLRQMQFSALRQLVVYHRALGEYTTAISLARRAISCDPFAEAAYRDLIALLYETGDRAAALVEYERFDTLLRDELGVEPMAESQALHAAIVRGGLLPGAEVESSRATAFSADTQALPRLIGREAEIDKLQLLWASAAAGRGRIVIVSGEAGVGKTLLASSAAEYAAKQAGLVLVGHCYEFERTLPYQAIVEMLRSAANVLRHTDLAPTHRVMLARLVPDVVGVASPPAEVSSDELRIRLLEAILQAFLALAQHQPVLLCVEDAHWAVGSTLDWLTYIAPRLGASRLLVVITYRTGEVGTQHALARLEQRFVREGIVSVLPLEPLSREANRDLVAELSGLALARVGPIADRLYAEAAGNPFFLHELVHGLIEAGQIKLDQGQWRGAFVEAGSDVAVALPTSLRATIAARVERLAEMARMFIRLAAVAGRVFDYALVRHAGDWPEELALGALEDLLARGFVRGAQADAKDSFAFAHHLVREAIYADMSTPRRAYLHRRLAETIQALRPNDFEALAYHFALAGDNECARMYYCQAGDHAGQLVALNDAARHYLAALARWPAGNQAERAETLYKLGQCQWVLMETERALESFEAAQILFETLGEQLKSGDMERMIGRMYWELGDAQAAWTHCWRALAILEQGPQTIELARVLSAIAQMYLVATKLDQAIRWGERALALAERLGAEDVIVHALNNIGTARMHIYAYDPERGLSMLRDSLRRALALRWPHDACRAYFNLSINLAGLCRYAEARSTYAELFAYASRVQVQTFATGAFRRLAALDWLAGRWGAALARRQQLVEQSQGAWAVWASRLFGLIDNDLGRPAAAYQELEPMLPRIFQRDDIQITLPHLGQLARAYAALGMLPEVLETIRQFIDQVDASPYLDWECTMPLLFACCWYADQPDWLGAARACIARLERADGQFRSPESAAALAEGCAAVALATGQPLEAAAQCRHAVAQWAAIGRPYDQARALGSLGRAQARLGDAAAARTALDQALALLDSLAAQLDDAQLRRSFLSSRLVCAVREARAGIESA
jgi:DNA-binding SARP family transcriptional activator